ncbi:Hypothetical protein HVR_LOCUS1352 [uncultured virus]|nr:Hypothetical protein HVR_LOCUS1352 [uncultured virus]
MEQSTSLLDAIKSRSYEKALTLTETEDPNVTGAVFVNKYYTDKRVTYEITPLATVIVYFYGDQRLTLVQKLLERGALPTTNGYWMDSSSVTPVHLAIYYKDLEVLKLLLSRSIPENLLKYTLDNGNFETIQYVYENCPHGAPEDYFLYSCAHNLETVAFFAERSQLSKELIEKGLYKALSGIVTCIDTVCYLWSRGQTLRINPNYHEKGYNYLYYLPNLEFLDKMLAGGFNIKDPNNDTAFHRHCTKGKTEFVAKLLSLNPEFANIKNKVNETVLLNCCCKIRDHGSHKYFPIMKLLQSHGADVNVCCNYGWTIASICACRGHLEELKIIIEEWGANLKRPNNSDQKWNDPIEMASLYEHQDVVQYLEGR